MALHTRSAVALAGTSLLAVGLDQASKRIVTATVEGHPPFQVIGRHLRITASRNSGAAFSFAPTETLVFTAMTLAIAVVIATRAPRLRSMRWAIALGLLLGGAVGNLLDRLMRAPGFGRGAVLDFIDVQHFAAFNIADICITVGAAMALLLSVRGVPMAAEAPAPPAAQAHT